MPAAHCSAFNPLSYGTIEHIESMVAKPILREVISFDDQWKSSASAVEVVIASTVMFFRRQ
jgi:hypothetical protein